jgi:hypothetical protein
MKLEFSCHIFEKYPNIKFHENPSSGSRIVQYEFADGRTDMTKLIVSFRNFANAPNQQFSLSVDTESRTPFDSPHAGYRHTPRIFNSYFSHFNNGYAKAPRSYVTSKLRVSSVCLTIQASVPPKPKKYSKSKIYMRQEMAMF